MWRSRLFTTYLYKVEGRWKNYLWASFSDQLIPLSTSMSNDDCLHEKEPEKEPWQRQFCLPFSSEYEIVIGFDYCLFSMKGRKENLLFIHFWLSFSYSSWFPFSEHSWAWARKEEKRKENHCRRNPFKMVLFTIAFFVKYHLILFWKMNVKGQKLNSWMS